jgi:hypothetical protein
MSRRTFAVESVTVALLLSSGAILGYVLGGLSGLFGTTTYLLGIGLILTIAELFIVRRDRKRIRDEP